MLAVDHYPYSNVEMPKQELLEIRRSKISLHHAKEGHSYPTIRLPYKFSQLAGLSTRIYQTVHDGTLAFLVVISRGCMLAANHSKKIVRTCSEKPESSAFTRRRWPVRIRAERREKDHMCVTAAKA
jgi:hypothetical protein